MSNDWRILSVEDDPDGQELVFTILTHMNIPIDVAYNAEQAESLLFDQGIRYNVIIVDLALPGKDGWNLLSDIRANPYTRDIPCVAVTAFHTSKLRQDALRAGFKAYFAKPLEAMAFARQVQALM